MNNLIPHLIFEITKYIDDSNLFNFLLTCKSFSNVFKIDNITIKNLEERKNNYKNCIGIIDTLFGVEFQIDNLKFNITNKLIYCNNRVLFNLKNHVFNEYKKNLMNNSFIEKFDKYFNNNNDNLIIINYRFVETIYKKYLIDEKFLNNYNFENKKIIISYETTNIKKIPLSNIINYNNCTNYDFFGHLNNMKTYVINIYIKKDF